MNDVVTKGLNLCCVKNTAPEIAHHCSLSRTKKINKDPFTSNIQVIVVKESAFLLPFFPLNKTVKFILLCEETYNLSLVG
jgi:hypothetical protein